MHLLDVLRRRAPVDFSLVAVNVDSGYAAYKHDVIARTCEARGWEYRIELCVRLRRGVLYRIAAEVGATKIALEHHADDFVETLLLNPAVCRVAEGDAGATGFRRRPARGHPATRLTLDALPLEADVAADRTAAADRSPPDCIRACRPGPGPPSRSMLRALGNVAPPHLLDTRLNLPGELRVAACVPAGLPAPLSGGATVS